MRALHCALVLAWAFLLVPAVARDTRTQKQIEYEDSMKYFHEPGMSDLERHYDVRFYSGMVTYEERTETLQNMIQAYLNFFREQRLETWIAHGTLLGWWWNGKMLPWDWDIDTQVANNTLAYLAQNLNGTRVQFEPPKSPSGAGGRIREYLLDVNPWYWERVRGDGFNIIDARWIDVSNGLFIDITGLAEAMPAKRPGVISCKNEHHYRPTDIYPLRDSTYEGVPALIPYAYDTVLEDEYEQKAFTLLEYEDHIWDTSKMEWIKIPDEEIARRRKGWFF